MLVLEGVKGGRKDFCSDTTIMCHCHSKIQSDTQLWWDWISSVFHNFMSKALSCLLQFSPLYQVESSLRLLICSLVCQAFSTSNNKHAENCSNYLYQVPILSAIQGWFQVSHEDFWFLWHARNGLSHVCLSHRFNSLNALFSCLLVTSLLFFFLTSKALSTQESQA